MGWNLKSDPATASVKTLHTYKIVFLDNLELVLAAANYSICDEAEFEYMEFTDKNDNLVALVNCSQIHHLLILP